VVDDECDAGVLADVAAPAEFVGRDALGFSSIGVTTRSPSSAKQTGTACGRPSASAVASRPTRAVPRYDRSRASNIRRRGSGAA